MPPRHFQRYLLRRQAPRRRLAPRRRDRRRLLRTLARSPTRVCDGQRAGARCVQTDARATLSNLGHALTRPMARRALPGAVSRPIAAACGDHISHAGTRAGGGRRCSCRDEYCRSASGAAHRSSPEFDWDDDQRQHELRDHHEEYGSAELREYPSLTSVVRDYGPRIPFRADDEKANNARGHGDAGQILADDEWPDNAREHGQAGQIPAGDEWPDNARGHGDAGQIQADDERPGDACGHGDADQMQADAEWPGNARGHGDAGQMQADNEWPDNACRREAGQITEEVRKSEDTLALLDRLLRSPRAA